MKDNRNKALEKLLPSLISVALGMVFGWYLLFVTKPADSLGGLGLILAGGFFDGASGIGTWLYTATPIILTGMAVGFSIRTGLFNIGASGQFTMASCVSILTATYFQGLPPFLHTLLAVLAGVLAAALWGALAGGLKAFCRVSEVITGIMLNYIAMLLTNILIRNYAYDSGFNRSADLPPELLIGAGPVGRLFPSARLNFIFPIAIAAVLLVKFLLDKTALGYELKIIGKNRNAGIYAGINDKKNIVRAMAISGALAGLGGSLMYLSNFGDHINVVETVLQQGFNGISVALLGMNDPVGIIIAGLFIAHITVGGINLQLYSYTPDVVNMIVAIIVYCGALVIPIRALIDGILREKERKNEQKKKLEAVRGKGAGV